LWFAGIAVFGLRRASEADIGSIWTVRRLAIERGCREHYPPESLARWVHIPVPEDFPTLIAERDFYVAADEARLAAFGFLDRDSQEIGALFVHPDFFGLGLGRRMLATLESLARAGEVNTLTLKATLNAERFYQAAGFVSESRDIWQHPAGISLECVQMKKELRGAAPLNAAPAPAGN
jgi:GNAT superfamily N-acetyltransferase